MRLHRKSDPYVFLTLPLLAYLFVVLAPIISSVYNSFFEWNGIRAREFVGLANFQKLLTDKNFHDAFFNTLKYSAVGTLCQVGGGMLLAILVQKVRKGQNLLRVILFTPTVISGMAMSQTFKKLLSISPDGVVNALLGAIGLSQYKTAFLANYDITLFVVAIVEAYRFTGLYMVIFHAAFTSIDKAVLESAAIDGATDRQILTKIKLPMIRGIICNAIVLAVVGTLKAFEGIFVLTNGACNSEVMATYMYKQAFTNMNYGYSSALSLLLVVECLAIYWLISSVTKERGNGR